MQFSDEKKQYVVVYPRTFSGVGRVLIVQKDRPSWQQGLYNLVGGKVEQGEGIVDCAVRELHEESGLSPLGYPEIFGTIEGNNATIHVVVVNVLESQPIQPRFGETERVEWFHWSDICEDRRLIPNLKVIIPLCAMGVKGWVIRDLDNEIGVGDYNIQVTIGGGV